MKKDKLQIYSGKAISSSIKMAIIIFVGFGMVVAQSYVIPPNTLIVEGVPKIPISVKERFVQNLDWEESKFLGWNNKNGDLVGFADKNVFFASTPNSTKDRTKVSLPSSDYLQFHPTDGKSFLFTVSNPYDDFQRVLYYYDDNKGKAILLTSPTEVQMVGSYEWSVDGNAVFYSNQNTKKGFTEIFRLNLETLKRVLVAKYEGDANYLIDASDKKLIVKNYFSNNLSTYYLLDLSTYEKTRFTDTDAYVNQAKFSHDGTGVWFLSNKKGDYYDLYYYQIKNRKTKRVNNFVANITDYSLSPNNRVLALKINEYGASRFKFFQTDEKRIGKELKAPSIPTGVIGRIQWRNNEEIGFDFQSTTIPTEIKSYNVRTGKLISWTKSDFSNDLSKTIDGTSLIKWKSFDEKEISGFMLKPKVQKINTKLPVIIDVHGGPDSQYTPIFDVYLANLASKLPSVIISPNVRGSSGFGKDFLDSDNKDKRENAVKDLQSLLDWIGQQPNLDSNNVFLRGTSYGGFLSLALGLKEQKRIRGIVAFVPLISIKEYLNFVTSSRRERDENEFGSLSDSELMSKNEALSLLSPNNLNNWKIPVLLVAGQNDQSASALTVDNLKEKLKQKGIPVWYIKATNEGHNWNSYSNYSFYELTGFTFFSQLKFSTKK